MAQRKRSASSTTNKWGAQVADGLADRTQRCWPRLARGAPSAWATENRWIERLLQLVVVAVVVVVIVVAVVIVVIVLIRSRYKSHLTADFTTGKVRGVHVCIRASGRHCHG